MLEVFNAAIDDFAQDAVVPTVDDLLFAVRDYLDSLSERALLLLLRDLTEGKGAVDEAGAVAKAERSVTDKHFYDGVGDEYVYEYVDEGDVLGRDQGAGWEPGLSGSRKSLKSAGERGLARHSRGVSFNVSSEEFAL